MVSHKTERESSRKHATDTGFSSRCESLVHKYTPNLKERRLLASSVHNCGVLRPRSLACHWPIISKSGLEIVTFALIMKLGLVELSLSQYTVLREGSPVSATLRVRTLLRTKEDLNKGLHGSSLAVRFRAYPAHQRTARKERPQLSNDQSKDLLL